MRSVALAESKIRRRGSDGANDNFLITVRFFGSFPLLFTVWFAVTKEVIQMDKDSLAHSNHKRIHLCLCFYVSEW